MFVLVIGIQKKEKVIAKNKCGGGIDLFITYVCREKKKKKKREIMCTARKRKSVKKKKKWINVPFPYDLGGWCEVKAQ